MVKPAEKKSHLRVKRIEKSIYNTLRQHLFSRTAVVHQLPFFFFLTLLALFYIANINQINRTILQIEAAKQKKEQLRSEYIIMRAKFMEVSRPNTVIERLKPYGLKESAKPPVKLKTENP